MRWRYILPLVSSAVVACSSDKLGVVRNVPEPVPASSMPVGPVGPDGSSPPPQSSSPESSDAGATPAAGATPDAGPTPVSPPPETAARPALPQVPNRGGPVLRNPQMVVLTFDDDPNGAALTDHARWMMTTWLPKVASEYGVGAGQVIATASLGPAPTTFSETGLETTLGTAIAAGQLPAPTSGVFYMIYVPAGTTLTTPSTTTCAELLGSHGEASYGGLSFVYGFATNCPGGHYPLGLDGLSGEEVIASRVVAMLATNPYFQSNPAYGFPGTPGTLWSFLGRDVSAFCLVAPTPYRDGAYYAQRVYSNAAASAGTQDPCVPADPAAPYFNIASAQLEANVAAGSSGTVPFVAWSNMTGVAWTLSARTRQSSDFQPVVQLAPAGVTAGTPGSITITVPAGTPSGQSALVEVVSGQQGATTPTSVWPLLVVAP